MQRSAPVYVIEDVHQLDLLTQIHVSFVVPVLDA